MVCKSVNVPIDRAFLRGLSLVCFFRETVQAPLAGKKEPGCWNSIRKGEQTGNCLVRLLFPPAPNAHREMEKQITRV